VKEESMIAKYRLQNSETKIQREKNDLPDEQIPVPPDQELPAPIHEPVDPENPDVPIDEENDKPKMIV
jgi:hypothetical protein